MLAPGLRPNSGFIELAHLAGYSGTDYIVIRLLSLMSDPPAVEIDVPDFECAHPVFSPAGPWTDLVHIIRVSTPDLAISYSARGVSRERKYRQENQAEDERARRSATPLLYSAPALRYGWKEESRAKTHLSLT